MRRLWCTCKTGLISIIILFCFFTAQASEEAIRHTRLGKAYFESGNLEEALKEFQTASELSPEDTDILYNLGGTLEKLGRHEEAVSQFATIKEMNPEDTEAARRLKLNLNLLLDNLKQQTATRADDASLWMQIALISRELELHDSTIEASRRAISINPNIPYVHHALARALFSKGQVKEAFAAIEKAFALKPEDDDIFSLLQTISAEMEKYDENNGTDNVDVDAALADTAADSGGISEQIRVLSEAGDWEAAISILETALIRMPDNTVMQSKLEELKGYITNAENASRHFERGQGYLEEERYLLAEEQLIRAEKTVPNRLDFRQLNMAFAQALTGLERYEESLSRINRVISQNPSDLSARISKAQLLMTLGKKEEALAEYETVVNSSSELKAANPGPIMKAESALSSHQNMIRIRYWGGLLALLSLLASVGYFVYRSPQIQHKLLLKKAENSINSGNWHKSADALSNLLILENLTPREKHWALLNHATSLIHTGNNAQAIQQAKKALALNPNHRETHLTYARAALKTKLISKEALYEYKMLLDTEPENGELILHLSSIFTDPSKKNVTAFQKDLFPSDGEAVLMKALKLRPADPAILRSLGDRFTKINRLDKTAVSVYEKLLRLDFENKNLHKLLASAYQHNENFEGVIRELKYIFQTDTTDPSLHDMFVNAHEKLNALPALLLEYEAMIQAEPDDMMLNERISALRRKYSVGRTNQPEPASITSSPPPPADLEDIWARTKLMIQSGKYNQAITSLKALINSGHNHIEASLLLIQAFLGKGLHDLAWEQYCSLNVDDTMVSPQEKAVFYELARSLEDNDRLREAWEIFDLICRVDISYEDAFERFEQLDEYVRKV